MDDFYSAVGPMLRLIGGGNIQRPVPVRIMRILIGVLFMLLVPLLYATIFRARKKHATSALGQATD